MLKNRALPAINFLYVNTLKTFRDHLMTAHNLINRIRNENAFASYSLNIGRYLRELPTHTMHLNKL